MPDTVKLTHGASLAYAHFREVRQTLQNGGLCVVPSDTGYSLAGLVALRGVSRRISEVLQRGQEPISLAFGTLGLVEKYATLTAQDLRVIDLQCPGPVTLICKMRNDAASGWKTAMSEVLHTDGTVGIRIPDSPVERQISSELGEPITTCAIRDDSSAIVKDFDTAVDIVRAGMTRVSADVPLVCIRMNRIKYRDQSTVVTVQPELAAPYEIRVFRPGVIEASVIRDAIRHVTYADVEDWT